MITHDGTKIEKVRNYLIVDLDGTLCNSSHRQHLAQARQWDEFHSLIHLDTVCEEVATVILALQKYNRNLITLAVTGRNESNRVATAKWLLNHRLGALFDEVLMRPDFDGTPDHDLKPKMLEEYFGSKDKVLENVLIVLEDRTKVVESLRNYGLVVFQVREGDY